GASERGSETERTARKSRWFMNRPRGRAEEAQRRVTGGAGRGQPETAAGRRLTRPTRRERLGRWAPVRPPAPKIKRSAVPPTPGSAPPPHHAIRRRSDRPCPA